MKSLRLCALSGLLLAGAGSLAAKPPAAAAPVTAPAAIQSRSLQNLFRVTPQIFSGGAPEGEVAFAELNRLGVRTVLSVDGIQPDVAMAHKYGLRYVHLPFGYDGIPTNRVAELIKTAETSIGPIYVHCHHGLHRGPTAVAVICEATAGWTTNRAIAWLQQAGTATDYPGLYRSAQEFQRPCPEILAQVTELPEVTKSSSRIDRMVAIDEVFDRLKAAQKSGWDPSPKDPARAPAEQATLLGEHFRELQRAEANTERPGEYRTHLREAEAAAEALQTGLKKSNPLKETLDAALHSVGMTCVQCHRQFRN